MSGSRKKTEEQSASWARTLLDWFKTHPIISLVALFVLGLTAVLTLAQNIDWVIGKLWPSRPNVIEMRDRGTGGNFSITVENPKDIPMVVTDAVLRAEPPPDMVNANDAELVIPAVTYSLPFDCSPGTKRVRLNPSFKVAAKDVGAVVFRSTLPMRDCKLFLSLETSQGRTAEKEGISLGSWRRRSP